MPTIVNTVRKPVRASPPWEIICVIAFAFTGLLITAVLATTTSLPPSELPF